MLVPEIPLDMIIRRVIRGWRKEDAAARWNPAKLADLAGAQRVEAYIFSDDIDAIDCFYNGRMGYRAAYAESEAAGEQANRLAVTAVLDLVREAMATVRTPPGVAVETSLAGPGTKVGSPRSGTRVCNAPSPGRLFLRRC